MLGMDEPVHGRLRSLVSKAFSQKSLARWQDELVGRVGNELIDGFAGERQGRPGQGVHLRLPEPDHRRAAGTAGGGLPAVPALVDLAAELDHEPGTRAGGGGGAVRVLRADPGRPVASNRREDLISALAAAEIDGEKLDGRGDLLVPAAAAARRCRDHVPVAGQPALRACCRIRRNSTRSAPTGR